MRLRIHGIDASQPSGTSNAGSGWTAVVTRSNKYYTDDGILQKSGLTNPKSEYYNPFVINEVHIPIKGNPILEE